MQLENPRQLSRILVSDFDGTLTRTDFYRLVLNERPQAREIWDAYRNNAITMLRALQRVFGSLSGDEEEACRLAEQTEIQPDLDRHIVQLRQHGWEVAIVSSGCRWYIDYLLKQFGVEIQTFASPGKPVPGAGLRMRPAVASPYFSAESGMDKPALVEHAHDMFQDVAYAGNSQSDTDASLRVEPSNRFAHDELAERLDELGESYVHYDRWADIVHMLCERT